MLVGAGNRRHGSAKAALLAASLTALTALTGCSEAANEGAKQPAPVTASATAREATAESGGNIGAADSACKLPVTFDIAKDWTAEAVTDPPYQGPVGLVCEVDAKPAGHIGFLRVWTAGPGTADARAVLEAFVTADKNTSKARYSTFQAGPLAGVEVTYAYQSQFDDTAKTERALAVTTPRGPAVVHLGGLDDGEHEAMLPAFELVKRTLKA
ncbi:lipoprotein [Streptomyces sp. NPDC047042]|uniref:lipoprotein n=1 Tax=Streptomyces sp. NPDC047042 TaxID=3154807 RepID=UPI00340024AF